MIVFQINAYQFILQALSLPFLKFFFVFEIPQLQYLIFFSGMMDGEPMLFNFPISEVSVPKDYFKLANISHSQIKSRKYNSSNTKKYPKQMFLKFGESALEFYSCPIKEYANFTLEYKIQFSDLQSAKKAVRNEDNKSVLGIVDKRNHTTAIRFEKDQECTEIQEKLEKYIEKSNTILKIGKEKNYMKLEEDIMNVRRIIFVQKDEKRWIFQQLWKRSAQLEAKYLEEAKELILTGICDDEPQMIQAKFNQRAQSYEIEDARSKVERDMQKKQIMENKELKLNVQLEGYSRKRQFQGIIPEEKSDLNLNPVERKKLEQEQLFINSIPDYNFEDDQMIDQDMEMDIEQKQSKQKPQEIKICKAMKIPQKTQNQYTLFQKRKIQFYEPIKNQVKKTQERKQRQKQELQVTKRVVETVKLFYRLNKLRIEEGKSILTIFIDQIRRILTDFEKRCYDYPHLREFIKKTKQNYLQQIKY